MKVPLTSLVINWSKIENACPEFIPNHWDLVLATIAVFGVVASLILICKFRKQMKESVFLTNLAELDFGFCLLYLWMYFFSSGAVYFKNKTMVELRVYFQVEDQIVKDFFETAIVLLMFFIILEKFLWTCSSRTRQIFRVVTIGKNKYWLALIGCIGYSVLSAFIKSRSLLQYGEVPFCDLLFRPVGADTPFLRVPREYVLPWVPIIAVILTFIFALITLCRISRVGEGEKPLNQEEVDLANVAAETPRLTTGKIKRSIICMLAVYFTFLVHAFCFYVYISPFTTNINSETRNTRILRNWSFDFMNVVFAGSRIIVYYVFCRNQMVVEFAPNALQNAA